ncbi:MAG: DeoR/GlpR family DNA-binding transcription regulator [Gaiellaceae bacterium]
MSENDPVREEGGKSVETTPPGDGLDQLVSSPSERRERMLALIKEREFARVGDLSDRFGISEVTVRSDLSALAERGQIHRIHGGAIPRAAPGQERPFEESETSFAVEKLAIGRAAASLVRDGESVIIDVGTTAVATARALTARTELRDIVVFTNGLKTALALESAVPRIAIVVLGGTLRPLQHSLVDPLATHILDRISASTLLLGCNGVHPTGGVTNINLPEAEIKRHMLRVARRRIVLADGSKIGRIELAQLCGLDQIDMIITGESADPSILDSLKEHGCEVWVVR